MLFGRDSKFEENKILTQKTYLDKVWTQNSDMKSPFHTQEIAAMLSLNYQFNGNHVMGVRYDFSRDPQIEMQLDMNSSIHVDNQLEEESRSKTHSMTTNNRHTVNAYYNGNFKDWKVDLNVDGMWIDSNNPIVAEEYVKQSDHTEGNSTIHTLGKSRNELYAAKLIMEHPLWEGNFSIGGEYTYSSRTDSYINDENIIPDNENKIRENAVSAFAMYARSFGQLHAEAGLRYEHLNSDYYEFGKGWMSKAVNTTMFSFCIRILSHRQGPADGKLFRQHRTAKLLQVVKCSNLWQQIYIRERESASAFFDTEYAVV